MLDAFDNYNETRGASRHTDQFFNPKFDVRETDTTYELNGELPGVDRDNLQIEFTEPRTVTISGHVERNYSFSRPKAEAKEAGKYNESQGTQEAAEGNRERAITKQPKTESTIAESGTPLDHYWHRERSVGQFQRTFTFPHSVDENGVRASLKDGILHVSIPKSQKQEHRHITVE
jgi:HSP20 family molecular chaperone IbpA